MGCGNASRQPNAVLSTAGTVAGENLYAPGTLVSRHDERHQLFDSNLALGRESAPAIHFGDSVVTYKQLAEPSEDLYRSPGFRAFRSGPIKYTAKGRIREGIAENKHR